MRCLPVPLVGLMAIALMLAGSSPAEAAPKFSPWGEPRNLGCTVNSPFLDLGPAVSKDGLTLFFGSTRPTAPGDTTLDFNIWVSRRASRDAPWEAPVLLGINTPVIDNIPSLSRDEHWLFFNSNRPVHRGRPADPVLRVEPDRSRWLR